jgi:NAD(P)-dependent dehydrogenase (short-subunit alcohol dehydrogenase family)
MATIALTGSASGIGAATADVLRKRGDNVIGVDLHHAEVTCDLSTPEGRETAVKGVLDTCGGELDGAVACAGISLSAQRTATLVTAVNYFGAVSFLAGLRPALAKAPQPAAVAISSNSTIVIPNLPQDLLDACLEGDEARALAVSEEFPWAAYAGSKTALAHWVRLNAVKEEWVGAGIRLNAVAPGRVRTAMDDEMLADENMRGAIESFPIPVGEPARAEEIGGFVAFLLSDQARFFCGSVLFQDGGTDALLRARDWPVGPSQ